MSKVYQSGSLSNPCVELDKNEGLDFIADLEKDNLIGKELGSYLEETLKVMRFSQVPQD